MAESSVEVLGEPARRSMTVDEVMDSMNAPDVHGTGMKLESGEEVYGEYEGGLEDNPSKGEVIIWCVYELCSYFISMVVIPILFPLLISQIHKAPQPSQGWYKSFKALSCTMKEMQAYQGLTYQSINVDNHKFSALEWTSISWFIGLILSAPLIGFISINLDYSRQPQLLAGAATALGAIFCLPVGFFKTFSIFPPYIALIVAASTVGTASHTRHLGLMLRGFMGPTVDKRKFTSRQGISSWLSLYSTSAGCLGAAIFSAFTYHMLRGPDKFTSLWVVAIFSGLMWLVGTIHIFVANRPSQNSWTSNQFSTHVISIFAYPHAAGTLFGVFLSSFSTMCIFTGGLLYLVGQLCFKTENILFMWLTYFVFPLLSLPLLHPLQQLIRADAVKMQLLGFLLSTLTAGFGFYYRHMNWQTYHVLLFSAVQSTASGVLYAFGRNLLLDCAPAGKEGAFSGWFSWVRAVGMFGGFAVATSGDLGNVSRPFGVAFCASIIGIIVLIFGNISSLEGAIAAGSVRKHSMHGYEDGVKGDVYMEARNEAQP